MVQGFRDFLKEQKTTCYFTFGRMNPPTRGHEKLLDSLAEKADKNPYKIFLSKSHDSKKNPLLYEDKLRYSRKFFPRHARSIVNEAAAKDIITCAVTLYESGYKSIVCVVGDDRLDEFKERLDRYNDVNGPHGYYIFESIEVVSAGHRDPDGNNIEGVSSTKLRESAFNSNFVEFSRGLPKSASDSEAKEMFNKVRSNMGLNEKRSFKNHLKLKPVSEAREKYIRGDLYEINDEIVIKESHEVAHIKVLGSNYVIVETSSGKRLRKWLEDVEKIGT